MLTERVELLRRPLTAEELEELDLKTYLASSSGDEEEPAKQEAEESDEEKLNDEGAKLLCLITYR